MLTAVETLEVKEFRGEYTFLSNFYPVRVEFDHLVYPSVEHAYQAAKTFDVSTRQRIRACRYPGEAKRMGQRLELRPDWDRMRIVVMYNLVEAKFKQEPFRSLLLATGPALLVEGNWWKDRFWGVYKGEGENHLGKILMDVRTILLLEAKASLPPYNW